MHLHYDPPDFIALANTMHQERNDPGPPGEGPDLNFGGDNFPNARDLIGQMFWDLDGNRLGVLTDLGNGRIAFVLTGPQGHQEVNLSVPFVPGAYLLASGQGVVVGERGNEADTFDPRTVGGSGGGGLSLGQQITLLEVQARLARDNGDHARAADFLNQKEILQLNQEFQGEQNELSRENQVRLQRLGDLSRLQQQILSDKARGRELLTEMIGNDPIRAGAVAQGLTPRRGTPADLFRTELKGVVDQPLVQPASTDIGDINAAISLTQERAGLPTPGTLGFNIPSAAHGGIIDMKKNKGGQFRVLVGEQGPELLEGNRNQIQITPIASAAHGGRISFAENPFDTFDVPGFRSGPTSAPRTSGPQRIPLSPLTEPRIDLPGPSPIRQAQQFAAVPGDISLPVTDPRAAPPIPSLPPPTSSIGNIEFEQPGDVELSQGLSSIFDFLGFSEVPTFTEGPFGGMQIPRGGLDALNTLGIDPSLLRTVEGGRGTNFFVTPSGELQQLSSGGQFQQALGLGPGTDSGFLPSDFLTVDSADFAAQGFGAPTPFTGQGLASAADPFPSPRVPLTIPSDVTGGAGILLPDASVIASLWPRLPPSVRAVLMSAYGVSENTSVEDQRNRLNFFTPSGSFSGRPAGFG